MKNNLHTQSDNIEYETDNFMLKPDDLNAIRAHVDWQGVFIGLNIEKDQKRSKPQDWWGYSPFHNENTPSFHMGAGGLWYDFSLSEGGGVIELIQKLKNYNCYEAAHFILENGWSYIPDRNYRISSYKKQKPKEDESQRYPCNTRVSEQENEKTPLFNAPIRQDLMPLCSWHDYLEERGISEKTCQVLEIGYLAQGRSNLKGRIVFQIADARLPKSKQLRSDTNIHESNNKSLQRVILSHVGRTIRNEEPKYLFYKGFHKSCELYGQDILWLDKEAEQQIKETGYITLCEGMFDVAKAFEAGLRNVVAYFGSSLSLHQAKKLKELCENFDIDKVNIIFDRDEAGQTGIQKACELLVPQGLEPIPFNWEQVFHTPHKGKTHIPKHIKDLADFSIDQINWLRSKRFL